jgi:hypothetical protein
MINSSIYVEVPGRALAGARNQDAIIALKYAEVKFCQL